MTDTPHNFPSAKWRREPEGSVETNVFIHHHHWLQQCLSEVTATAYHYASRVTTTTMLKSGLKLPSFLKCESFLPDPPVMAEKDAWSREMDGRWGLDRTVLGKRAGAGTEIRKYKRQGTNVERQIDTRKGPWVDAEVRTLAYMGDR
ncbi:hypothetical protein Pcinc_036071 [Petrolisthes cinctipes]|uniref:Uncharacterized protein n=1 Tax=Petrolisthes cinctipes TaxID=88211 RepID=A0AAE1BVM3_PETCI|nr:hypothetical protein Pcinc_036071 [Petrolisthes cinctipes]